MAALNAECFGKLFRETYWRQAQGFDKLLWGPSNGGLASPQEVNLELGHTYWRFCDSQAFHRNPRGAMAGSWWIEHETLMDIYLYARDHADISERPGVKGRGLLSYVAALHLAIPPEWGDCFWIVRANLKAVLRAWCGQGRMAQVAISAGSLSSRYTPLRNHHGFTAKQYFVPDMSRWFEHSFKDVKAEPASHVLRRGPW